MKKKFKLKALSILMAILMVATIIPIGAISSFAVTSGDYDYSVISETKKTVSIDKYTGTGGDITIPSTIDSYTVTGIDHDAFNGCTSLISVKIPDSVTNIESWAFEGCTGLISINVSEGNTAYSSVDGVVYSKDKTSIFICPTGKSGEFTIPNGVTSIAWAAFSYCTGLTSVTIPNSVTVIDGFAFFYCKGLKGVTIPESVTSIGNNAFYNCTGLIDVTIPDSVTGMGEKVFDSCAGLKGVKIGNGLTNIGFQAFLYCTGLKSVSIGDSVTIIDSLAFEYCSSLEAINVSEGNTAYSSIDGILYNKDKTELFKCPEGKSGAIVIPDSVTNIDGGAFSGTQFYNSLPNGEIYFGKVFYKYKGIMPKDTEINIKDGTVSISGCAFYGCTGLKGVIISDGVTSIGYGAFNSCTGLAAINVSEGNTKYSSIDGVLYNKNKTELLQCPEGKSGEVIIPNSVTKIGYGAFSYCTGLTSVIIPNSVTSTGPRAFKDCTGLKGVIISDGVTSIDYETFIGCTSLTSVTIPESVTSIGFNAFYDTPFYNSQPDGEVYLGKVLYAYKGTMPKDTEINIKPGTASITGSIFRGCTDLKGVTIPDSVTSIGVDAFYDTPFYSSLPDGEIYFGKVLYAYKGTMPENTEINIKAGTISISGAAFYDCAGLIGVIIPDSVTSIGGDAFFGCTGLTNVTIPNSVTSIGDYAFFYCTGLKGVIIPSSVTSIGDMAFGYHHNNYGDYEKLPGFTITGFKGSTAEEYAIEYGFNFIDIPQEDVIMHAENFDYRVISEADKTIEIVKFTGTGTEVLVPDSINGYTISSIATNAFAGCSSDFVIKAPSGSVAEKYAKENNIIFVDATAPTRMLGDVNGDDKVTAADAILALRAEAKLKELSPEEFKAADVTGDGKVTAADAIKILRFEAKLITAL